MSRRSARVTSRFDAAPGQRPGRRGGGRDAMLWLLAGVLAIAGFIVLNWPSGSSSTPERPPSTETTTSSAQQPHPTNAGRVEPPSSNPTPIPKATLDSGALAVIEGFATDFTADVDIDAWIRNVSQWVTPQLAESYAQTASSRQPSGEVTAITPEAVGAHAVEAVISYDSSLEVSVRAEISADGWQVTSVLPQNH